MRYTPLDNLFKEIGEGSVLLIFSGFAMETGFAHNSHLKYSEEHDHAGMGL